MKGIMSNLDSFRALGVSEETIKALAAKGFEQPSPIQAATIPKLLDGTFDVIGQAQTGTGKTAAFGIPIIELAVEKSPYPQALILAPTRELSIQIAEELNSMKGTRRLRIAPFYGGQAIEIQLQRLRDGVDIVIGTPGRVIDLIERGKLNLSHLSTAVLDEADEMLNMGFVEDIEKILSFTNTDKRMLMFSATMPPEIQKIAERFMRQYEVVRTVSGRLDSDLTEQIYFEVRREDKLEALSRIIDMEEDIYALVFCRTRNDVDELAEKLQSRGHFVETLHGDIAQAQRTRVINQFKAKKFKLLIATDVAARGIDVNDLTHVINYSIPQDTENYVHRIGRTGRAGKNGTAITFVTPAEYRKLVRIKQEAKADIKKQQLPQPKDVVAAKKLNFASHLMSIIEDGKHGDYVPFAEELLAGITDPAELLAAILQQKFKGELLEKNYNNIGGQGPRHRDSSPDSSPDGRGRTRLFVGIGKADGYGVVSLLNAIEQKTGIRKSQIGKVDCLDKFSFINVNFEDAERIIAAFRRGGPTVEIATERPDRAGDDKREYPRDDRREFPREEKREYKREYKRADKPEVKREDYSEVKTEVKTEVKAQAPEFVAEAPKKAKEPKDDKAKPKTPTEVKKKRLKEWVDKIAEGVDKAERKKKKIK